MDEEEVLDEVELILDLTVVLILEEIDHEERTVEEDPSISTLKLDTSASFFLFNKNLSLFTLCIIIDFLIPLSDFLLLYYQLRDSEKSEAQGWGADEGKKELEAEVLGESDAKTEAAPADGSAPVAAKEEKVYPVQEEEEEDNTQTYDEYLAAQAEKKLNIALPEARVANEGVDEAQWEGQTLVAKKGANEDEWFTGAAVRFFYPFFAASIHLNLKLIRYQIYRKPLLRRRRPRKVKPTLKSMVSASMDMLIRTDTTAYRNR